MICYDPGISWALPDQPHATIVNAITGTTSSFVASLDEETREKILLAIVNAMSRTFIITIVGGGLIVLMSLGMKWEKLFMTASVGG